GWLLYGRDRPAQHPGVNAPELAWIEGHASAPPQGARAPRSGDAPAAGGWWSLLRNRSVLLLTLCYMSVGYFEYLFFYWMHYYFDDVLRLGPAKSQFYAGVPPLAMALGLPLGGWLSDRLQPVVGHRLGHA